MAAPTNLKVKLVRLARYLERGEGIPPFEYILGKLCRSFETTPGQIWKAALTEEGEDVTVMYGVLDQLSYADAWDQFVRDPEHTDYAQQELIGEIRTLMLDEDREEV